MKKKVSMDIIAQKLGVSKIQFPLAMRNMPGLSDQTRKLILETAKLNGYEYKKTPKSLTNITPMKNICIMMSHYTRDSMEFFSNIQFGIEDTTKANNYNSIIYYFEDNQGYFEPPLCIRENLASGIIILGGISRTSTEAILKYNLPVVLVDHFFDDIKTDCVLTDNRCAAYTATQYLIKNNHRDIAFSGNIKAAPSFYDRYQGYLQALNAYDISVIPDYLMIETQVIHPIFNVEKHISKFKTMEKLPTAVFCCNDIEAINVIKALHVLGIRVPDDISVIGFDNIELSKNTTPELTTVNVNKEYLGKIAVEKLIQRIADPGKPEQKVSLWAPLIERNSVRNL